LRKIGELKSNQMKKKEILGQKDAGPTSCRRQEEGEVRHPSKLLRCEIVLEEKKILAAGKTGEPRKSRNALRKNAIADREIGEVEAWGEKLIRRLRTLPSRKKRGEGKFRVRDACRLDIGRRGGCNQKRRGNTQNTEQH